MAMTGLTAKGVPANLPKFLFFIKVAIIVLSVIILALAAYAIAVFSTSFGVYGSSGTSGLVIFTVIKTWIIYGALIFIELKAPHLYFRLAVVIACAISIVFWLSAWAWSASIAAFWLSYDTYYYDSYINSAPWHAEGAALAACAGLGAIVWILSIVHLVFFIRACMHDSAPVHQAELGHVGIHKTEANSTVYPATGPAPVQYGQPAPGVYQQQPAYGQPAPYQQPQQPYPQ